MPHSPRWINGALYCLLSATGELVKINTTTGNYEIITKTVTYKDYLQLNLAAGGGTAVSFMPIN